MVRDGPTRKRGNMESCGVFGVDGGVFVVFGGLVFINQGRWGPWKPKKKSQTVLRGFFFSTLSFCWVNFKSTPFLNCAELIDSVEMRVVFCTISYGARYLSGLWDWFRRHRRLFVVFVVVWCLSRCIHNFTCYLCIGRCVVCE